MGKCFFEIEHNFKVVKGSSYISEYEPSLIHYKERCMGCGETRYRTKEKEANILEFKAIKK